MLLWVENVPKDWEKEPITHCGTKEAQVHNFVEGVAENIDCHLL